MTVTERDGGIWTYTLYPDGNIASSLDPTGRITTYTYYSDDHEFAGLLKEKVELVEVGTNDGEVVTIPEIMVDAYKVTTHLGYDRGRPSEIAVHKRYIGTDIFTNEIAFSTNKLPFQHFKYTYDNVHGGAISSITDLKTSNAVTTMVYEADPGGGERLTVTDPAQNQIVSRYNPNGTLKEIIGPYGPTSTFAYHSNGDLLSITDASGVRTEFLNYDSLGNAMEVKVIGTDNEVQENLLKYDAWSRLKSVTRNNVLLSTSSEAVTLLTEYNYGVSEYTVLDARGNKTTYKYNSLGQISSIKDAALNLTNFIYSGAGCGYCGGGVEKILGIIDANNSGGDIAAAKKTSFDYYLNGDLKGEVDPLGKTILYDYYPSGLVKGKWYDSNGDRKLNTNDQKLLSFTYTHSGKIKSKIDHISGEFTNYTYYPQGWIWTAKNPNIEYTFEYYDNGWIKSVKDSSGRVLRCDEYDGLGQRELMTLLPGTSDQKVLDYGYDTKGRLETVASAAGTFTFGYDSFGRRGSLAYPNGVKATYGYHPEMNWLTGVEYGAGGDSLLSIKYPVHDAVGNRKEREEDGLKTTYEYDEISRLRSASDTGSFNYDKVGNRTSGPTVKDTEAAAYTHNDANQMILGRKYAYEYDNFGNQAKRYLSADKSKLWQYTWDAEGQLTKAELKIAGVVQRTVTFKYDPFGRRIEKKVADASGTVTRSYVYDGEDIVLEYVGNGTATSLTHYVHGPGIDEPLAMVSGGQASYYHADGLGSVVAISDAARKIVQRYRYEAFGMVSPQHPEFGNAYAFTGREWDKEIGLYYYRARYYDPMEGRFISRDPIGFLGRDVNLYNYVWNNSINVTDPSGLEPPSDIYPYADIKANIREAQGMDIFDFVSAVRAGGKWDYKKYDPEKYENFGNYHYGVVSRAFRLTPELSLRGAGAYQNWTDLKRVIRGKTRIGEGCFLGGEPYGDDRDDQKWIMEGLKDYQDYFK